MERSPGREVIEQFHAADFDDAIRFVIQTVFSVSKMISRMGRGTCLLTDFSRMDLTWARAVSIRARIDDIVRASPLFLHPAFGVTGSVRTWQRSFRT